MDEGKETNGFTMGMEPSAGATPPDASGIDSDAIPPDFEMIGTMEMPKPKPGMVPAEEDQPGNHVRFPDEASKPAEERPANQAMVVGVKGLDQTTAEELTSFIVGLQNAESKEYEEYFIPRNTLKLLETLENTVISKGAEYTKTPIKVYKIVASQGRDGQPVAIKLQLIDASIDEAIQIVKAYMIADPDMAFSALLRGSEPVFESSDVIFIDVITYFKSKGCIGTTLMSPHTEMTEEDVTRYYNAMIAHADMFKSNMAKKGFDVEKGPSIIIPPKGFIPPKGIR